MILPLVVVLGVIITQPPCINCVAARDYSTFLGFDIEAKQRTELGAIIEDERDLSSLCDELLRMLRLVARCHMCCDEGRRFSADVMGCSFDTSLARSRQYNTQDMRRSKSKWRSLR